MLKYVMRNKNINASFFFYQIFKYKCVRALDSNIVKYMTSKQYYEFRNVITNFVVITKCGVTRQHI